MLAICDLNTKQLGILRLLLEDLTKTQYTRDDEGPYFCINVNNDYIVMNYLTITSIDHV